MRLAVSFVRGCIGFYATLLTRCVKNPAAPTEQPYTDGADGASLR